MDGTGDGVGRAELETSGQNRTSEGTARKRTLTFLGLLQGSRSSLPAPVWA